MKITWLVVSDPNEVHGGDWEVWAVCKNETEAKKAAAKVAQNYQNHSVYIAKIGFKAIYKTNPFITFVKAK